MNNELSSLNKLFQQYIFRVPDYQRGYSWTRTQLVDFWEDLVNLHGNNIHYTGMLTIKVVPNDEITGDEWIDESWIVSDDYNVCYVVDGQQRLTTSVILINEILNLAEKYDVDLSDVGNTSLEGHRRTYIYDFKYKADYRKCFKFGYVRDKNSFDFLKTRIFDVEFEEPAESYYTHNMMYAKEFFGDMVERYYSEGNELSDLFKKLTMRFKFNVFLINDGFQDVVAFETMNNRGKRLSVLEILKNRLIYLTSLMGFNDEEDRVSLRNSINSAWSEVYRQLGKDVEQLLDDDEYLRDHWIIYYGEYSSREGGDFASRLLNDHFNIRFVEGHSNIDRIDESNDDGESSEDDDYDAVTADAETGILKASGNRLRSEDISEYIESLKRTSKYWFMIHKPDKTDNLDEELAYKIAKINRAGVNYFKPLLLSCLCSEGQLDEKKVLLDDIERFIFIYFRLAQNNAGSYKNRFYGLASRLYWGKTTIADVSRELQKLTEENKTVALERFSSYIEGRFKNGEGYYNWIKPLKYFLYEYEEYLSRYADRKILWNNFVKSERDQKTSIEHIYPQNPDDSWPDWRTLYSLDDDRINRLTNSLGNILALDTRINSKLQNVSYVKKLNGNGEYRKGYKLGSHSENEVASKYPTEWTPVSIKERGLGMLKFMSEHWNIDLTDESYMLKLLGLQFMDVAEEESSETEKEI